MLPHYVYLRSVHINVDLENKVPSQKIFLKEK